MSRRVLKFGGSALRDGPAVRRVVELVGMERSAPIVVVSAHEGVTTLLQRASTAAGEGVLFWDAVRIRHRTILRELGLEGDLLDRHLAELRTVLFELARRARPLERQRRDYVLSFGERMSARVLAACLRRKGHEATPVDAFDLGVAGDALYGSDSMRREALARLRRALGGLRGVPVVTGFVALDRAGELTTLGRNGSDLTAVWIAAGGRAEEVVLYKTVAGIMSADPGIVPDATLLRSIDWQSAQELGAHGADVLHPGCVPLARESGLVLTIRGVGSPAGRGTRVGAPARRSGPVAIALRTGLSLGRLRLDPVSDWTRSGVLALERLASSGVHPLHAELSPCEATVLGEGRPAGAAGAAGATGATGDGSTPDREQAGWETGLFSVALVGPGVGSDEELRSEVEAEARSTGLEIRRAPGGARESLVWVLPGGSGPELVRILHARFLAAGSTAART